MAKHPGNRFETTTDFAQAFDKAIETLAATAKTGKIGDGKVFVLNVEQAMRVMMTGGTGFAGSHTVRRFLAEGHSVRLLVRSREKVREIYDPLGIGIPEQDVIVGDITDAESLAAKVATLYAQSSRDSVVIGAVTELEQVSANLSHKIWQKITLIRDVEEPVNGVADRVPAAGGPDKADAGQDAAADEEPAGA